MTMNLPITLHIDGKEVPSLEEFFPIINEGLQCPMPRKNLASFEKLFRQLEWLEGAKVRISITNGAHFLIEEDTQIRKKVLEIMIDAMEDQKGPSPIMVLVSKD